VVAAQVAGTVADGKLIDKKSMAAGDRILLTKALAVEGTSIIAREFPGRLAELGMTAAEIEQCRGLLFDPGISILREAGIASRCGRVSAMHDITEGGLSTALLELSAAGGQRIRVHLDRIPVLDATRRVCSLLALDPLGLIGSGSLLIACRPEAAEDLTASIRAGGIDAVCIGETLGPGSGVEAVRRDGSPAAWPQFAADEIARLFRRLKDARGRG
jgi:hydrogenase maturation factor